MSLPNRRRGRVSPPPAKYDPEWENQLRRAFEESILKPDDFTNSYPFNSPWLSGGRIEVTQISNVTGGPSNVTGEYTKTSPHDEESDVDGSHHWAMRQWRPPSYSGTAYYASPARLPESVTAGPNVSGFRLDYDNLVAWNAYDAIADALASTDTKICFQAPVTYSAQATLAGGAVGRVDDEMLAETTSLWQMSLLELRDGISSHALSLAYYQNISNNASGSLIAQQGILDVSSPLEAVDNPGAYCSTIRINATAADKYLYSTAADTWAEGAITAFGRSLLDDADAATGRNTLGASTGVWPATLGGTGQSSYTVGDLLYASTTTALSKLAAGTSGYVLTSGGAGVAPSWAAASAGVTGSGTANQVAYWSGTSALTGDADLVFNGTQLLTTGLFVGALTGTPARALEVRSTSAQIRGSYDALGNYWEIEASSTGNVKLIMAGADATRIAIGGTYGASTNTHTTQLGAAGTCAGQQSTSIGAATSCAGSYSVSVGQGATCAGGGSISIGINATCAGGESVSIGGGAAAPLYCVSVGYSASCAAQEAVAIGRGTTCGQWSTSIGAFGTCAGQTSVMIGSSGSCAGAASVALGRSVACADANAFVCGSSSYPTNDWYGGKGITNATPTAWTLNGTGGSGTNIAGGALCLGGGKGTGNAAGGSVKLQVSTAGASGTTLQTLATVIECGPATIGFYGVTPVARAAAYTQTYATAARTNPAVLTDSTTGTPGTTLVDVTAAHDQAKLNDNFASLNARLNTAMQLINALIDDSQGIGIAS